jgi:glycerol-3-phosphate O-acyltransferase
MRQQRAATLGPDLSHQRTVLREVLRSRAVRVAVAAEARARNLTRRQALLLARDMAREIAADYSHRFVSIMYRVLSRLWNRLYDGVDVFHAERLNLAVSGAQVVFVPCHRSHMDYLLLSYVIYHRGHAVPHVAAGVNLNIPVVGRYLRMGGAFFLRRSFKGSALYPAVFTRYLAVMMARGHSIEYFIEGGRSRTGRLLAPKTGMLSMTVRAFLRDPRRPVVFVPVYFGYERLMEGETYLGELSGKPKRGESVGDLLRVIPRLRERYGRVQVSFGEPLDLGTLLGTHAPQWREQPLRDDARPPWLGGAIDDLATTIMRRINAAATVTPTNLLATVLLAMPRQALAEADLIRQVELYQRLLAVAPYGPDTGCTVLDGAAIVAQGEAMGMLERRRHPLGDILRMREQQAVLATYARNNTLHLFAMPSLLACAFLNNPLMAETDLQRLAWRIYPYAAQELFLRFPEAEVPEVVQGLLSAFAVLGLLQREERDGQVLWHTTISTVERFYLALALLAKAGSGALTQEALELQCVHQASRMSVLYGLDSPDFFDRAMFRSFLELLRRRGILRTDQGGRLAYDDAVIGPVVEDAQRVLSEQIRHSVLQVTHG